MKRLSLISLLLGGSLLWAGYTWEEAAKPSEPPLPHFSEPALAVVHLDHTVPSEPKVAKPYYHLQMVEGISLQDNQEAVVETLGQPEAIQPDPYTAQCEVYRYPGIDVGFSMGIVDFVRVLPEAGTIDIDGSPIPMTLEAVVDELGKPDFVAEDGLVFKRQQAALKLFVSSETQQLTSIDYFHRTSS